MHLYTDFLIIDIFQNSILNTKLFTIATPHSGSNLANAKRIISGVFRSILGNTMELRYYSRHQQI